MENVLEVYTKPCDPLCPVVCLDKTNRQLSEERNIPISEPGQIEIVDYEYRRYGFANLFVVFEPLTAKRHVKVTDTRTRVDFANCVKELFEVH